MQHSLTKTPQGVLLNITNFQDAADTYDQLRLFTVPNPHGYTRALCHVEWQDQGWGNRKGCIGIDGVAVNLFSDNAPHERTAMEAVVEIPSERAGSDLHVTYVVGGGGGHTLTIHKLSLHFLHEAKRPTEPILKFHLHRKHGVEVHRVRGHFPFEQIQSFITLWWDGANVKYQYRDAEGDVVTMNSQSEWLECIRHHEEENISPVKIVVTKVGRSGPSTPQKVAAQRKAEVTAAPEAPIPTPHQQPEPVTLESVQLLSRENTTGNVIPSVTPVTTETVDITKTLLEILFGAEVIKKLWLGDASVITPSMGSIVRVVGLRRTSWNPEHRVDVDINIGALRAACSRFALDLLNKLENDRACEFLRLTSELPLEDPSDDIIIRYNYACALALTGHPAEAIQQLQVAVDHGYTNGAHMSKDEDLISLHAFPQFQDLLSKLKNVTQAPYVQPHPTTCAPDVPLRFDDFEQPLHVPGPIPAVVAPPLNIATTTPPPCRFEDFFAPPPPAAQPTAPLAIPAEVNPDVETLIALFPALDESAAMEILKSKKSLKRAIDFLLGS